MTSNLRQRMIVNKYFRSNLKESTQAVDAIRNSIIWEYSMCGITRSTL